MSMLIEPMSVCIYMMDILSISFHLFSFTTGNPKNMRNTTKLKILLQKYRVTFDMDEDEQFIMMLTDKDSGKIHELEGKSYSIVIAKAYSHLLQILKKPMEL